MQIWHHLEPFCNVTSLSELYFWFRRFNLWCKQNKWLLWIMTTAQEAENHGDEWGLTWYLRWEIYTLSLKMSSHGKSLICSQRPSHSTWEQLQAMWWNGSSHITNDGKSMETERIWSEFPNGRKPIVEQILAPEEINPKKPELWESQSRIWVRKLTIWPSE